MIDTRFLFNRYIRNRKITDDGLVWTFPKNGMLIYHQEEFLNDLILGNRGAGFVDVGANVGAWAIRAANAYSDVWAFESNTAYFKALKRNIRLNQCSNVYPLEMCVGDGADSTYKLDDHIGSYIPIQTLLIDVEGMGLDVLKGAQRTIQHHKPRIILEVHTEREALADNVLNGYEWSKRYRVIPPIWGDWLYRENDRQVFLIGQPLQ